MHVGRVRARLSSVDVWGRWLLRCQDPSKTQECKTQLASTRDYCSIARSKRSRTEVFVQKNAQRTLGASRVARTCQSMFAMCEMLIKKWANGRLWLNQLCARVDPACSRIQIQITPESLVWFNQTQVKYLPAHARVWFVHSWTWTVARTGSGPKQH